MKKINIIYLLILERIVLDNCKSGEIEKFIEFKI